MLRTLLVAFGLALAAAGPGAAQDAATNDGADRAPPHPLVQNAQHSPDCRCIAAGRSFAVGESACLRLPDGPRMAECGMVLNNTSWRFTERPCPES